MLLTFHFLFYTCQKNIEKKNNEDLNRIFINKISGLRKDEKYKNIVTLKKVSNKNKFILFDIKLLCFLRKIIYCQNIIF